MMSHCARIFPHTMTCGGYNLPTTSIEIAAYSLMLTARQMLEISCYVFETLPSLWSVFMAAILPTMIIAIMQQDEINQHLVQGGLVMQRQCSSFSFPHTQGVAVTHPPP